MKRPKSKKKVLSIKTVFGKRKFIFPMKYATEVDPETRKKGMLLSINSIDTFIPCGEPVDLTFDNWALLKNIGRIGRIVNLTEDD